MPCSELTGKCRIVGRLKELFGGFSELDTGQRRIIEKDMCWITNDFFHINSAERGTEVSFFEMVMMS